MSNANTTVRATTSVTNPTIYNVTVPLANTEVSVALSANTKKFLFRVRGRAKANLAFTSGSSGTTYITVPVGTCLDQDNISALNLVLYFQLDVAGQVVEILEWS